MSNELAVIPSAGTELFRVSTDAAGLCKEIVVATARNIQGRRYVQVEGWQAIAIAHGCTASSGDVHRTEEGGYSAIGKVIRMDTGIVIASAEGYVGPDEPVWFGGKNQWGKMMPKRADYAIRAMAQTRAISRACRSAFAHVVVMMNAGLSTTPAEEVPSGGFDDRPVPLDPKEAQGAQMASVGTVIPAATASGVTQTAIEDYVTAFKEAKTYSEIDEIWKQAEEQATRVKDRNAWKVFAQAKNDAQLRLSAEDVPG